MTRWIDELNDIASGRGFHVIDSILALRLVEFQLTSNSKDIALGALSAWLLETSQLG